MRPALDDFKSDLSIRPDPLDRAQSSPRHERLADCLPGKQLSQELRFEAVAGCRLFNGGDSGELDGALHGRLETLTKMPGIGPSNLRIIKQAT